MSWQIVSPLAAGNGAYVVHKSLEAGLSGYLVQSYNPWLTLFPPLLKFSKFSRKVDLIHTTPDYAIWSARDNIPLVATFHNYVLDPFMYSYSTVLQSLHYRTDLRWFTHLAVRRAKVLTAVSQFIADLACKDLGIDQNIRVIHNGIDESLFTPSRSPQRGATIKVLFAGNLTKRKGAQWILPIADRIHNGVQILYTSGMRTKAVLPEHPRISNLGNVPHEDMPALYRSVDILLLPTVREGLPMAVLEAMGSGIPVVATNCSSLPELIDHKKGGCLCRPGDVDQFAKKINELAESAALRHEMGQYNRAKIEAKYTHRQMVMAYQALFSELLE